MFEKYQKKYVPVRQSGMTLVEMMVTTVLFLFVVVGILSVYMMNLKIGFESSEKNIINSEVRRFSSQFLRDGRQAHSFEMFQADDSASADFYDGTVGSRNSGNVVVFVFTAPNAIDLGGGAFADGINRVVWYVYDGDASVVRAERILSTVQPIGTDVSSLVSTTLNVGGHDSLDSSSGQILMDASQGMLAGDLFYNLENRTVLVHGRSTRGNRNLRIAETFNFSVTTNG